MASNMYYVIDKEKLESKLSAEDVLSPEAQAFIECLVPLEEEEVKVTIDPEARKEMIDGINKDTESKLSIATEALEKIVSNMEYQDGGTAYKYQSIARTALSKIKEEELL